MLHREPRIAPEYIYPVDEWCVIEKRFAPRYLEQSETIFTYKVSAPDLTVHSNSNMQFAG